MNADKSKPDPDSADPPVSPTRPVDDGESKKKRIRAIQAKIAAGEYDTEERMEKALEALMKKMSGHD